MDRVHSAPELTGGEAGIPDKLFFRIGEVSQLVGVPPYVLRYWESEFRLLSPKKSSSGQRMFRRKDLLLLLEIKQLLYERKFTIEGARRSLARDKVLNNTSTNEGLGGSEVRHDSLLEIREEVAGILSMLA